MISALTFEVSYGDRSLPYFDSSSVGTFVVAPYTPTVDIWINCLTPQFLIARIRFLVPSKLTLLNAEVDPTPLFIPDLGFSFHNS